MQYEQSGIFHLRYKNVHLFLAYNKFQQTDKEKQKFTLAGKANFRYVLVL